MSKLTIEIAYALPDRYFLKSLHIEQGTTVQTAILQSGILHQFSEIDLRENKIGIFSRPAKLTDVLENGDRIEIYRPLLADPKEIRRKRAAQQLQEQQAQKQAEKEAKKRAKQLAQDQQSVSQLATPSSIQEEQGDD